jgi:ElaB/YqjD/DUF883 family membrane-anchored ribosome-binding protein
MIRTSNRRVPSPPAKLARDEANAAWDHLMAAAEHGRRRIGDTTRHTSKLARKRANLAARALRGERTASPWRWVGIGLAAGVALGAAAGAALARRPEADTAVETIRERTTAARERTTAAAHKAADTARDTAARVREVARSRGNGDGQPEREPDPHATVK